MMAYPRSPFPKAFCPRPPDHASALVPPLFTVFPPNPPCPCAVEVPLVPGRPPNAATRTLSFPRSAVRLPGCASPEPEQPAAVGETTTVYAKPDDTGTNARMYPPAPPPPPPHSSTMTLVTPSGGVQSVCSAWNTWMPPPGAGPACTGAVPRTAGHARSAATANTTAATVPVALQAAPRPQIGRASC